MDERGHTDACGDGYTPVIGICKSMCPENEIIMREKKHLLHYFEKPASTDPGSVVNDLAVKEYSRPAAGRDHVRIRELRPAAVLKHTCHYLIYKIVPRTDLPWYRVYEFVFNRLRSVRQDMVIQRITGPDALNILQYIVRFHIYAGYRLCDESADNYDSQINDTHLQECLHRLMILYNDFPAASPHQAEFLSLYLLVNLGDADTLRLGLQRKSDLRNNRFFCCALDLSLAWWKGNYIRTLHKIQLLNVLQACAVHRHLLTVRSFALERMSRSHSGKNLSYPISHLSKLLLLDDSLYHDEVQKLCAAHGITVENDQVVFAKADFKFPSKKSQQREQWIDALLDKVSVSQLILEGT